MLSRVSGRPSRRMRCSTTLMLIAGVLLFSAGAPDWARAADGKDAVQTAGDIGQFVPPAAGLLLAVARKDGKGVEQLALSTAATLSVVYALKYSINRKRPDGGDHSFPSGHTALAFAGAGFLHLRYGWEYGLPAYALGVFVGYSRVHAKQHYTTDVIAGGAIGIAANVALTRRWHGVAVTPIAGDGRPGLSISASW
jgi:membrane-associated phospholipid phosphatase